MRVKKISALALVVAAAGLSLTACGSSEGSSAASSTNASASASDSTDGQGSAPLSSSSGSSSDSQGSASGSSASGSSGSSSSGSSSSGSSAGSDLSAKSGSTTSGSMCKTDNLGFSAVSAGVKNEIVVNLKNNGPSTCSMHGFPGVQLVGPEGLGDTGPNAARTDVPASSVTIAAGEETRFLLHYIPDTSGSGKTYTRLSVTPPNERVSEIVNLKNLDITVSAAGGNAPDVYVDPIGYHTGSGK